MANSIRLGNTGANRFRSKRIQSVQRRERGQKQRIEAAESRKGALETELDKVRAQLEQQKNALAELQEQRNLAHLHLAEALNVIERTHRGLQNIPRAVSDANPSHAAERATEPLRRQLVGVMVRLYRQGTFVPQDAALEGLLKRTIQNQDYPPAQTAGSPIQQEGIFAKLKRFIRGG